MGNKWLMILATLGFMLSSCWASENNDEINVFVTQIMGQKKIGTRSIRLIGGTEMLIKHKIQMHVW